MTAPFDRDVDPLTTTTPSGDGSTSPIGDGVAGQTSLDTHFSAAPTSGSEEDPISGSPDIKDRAGDVASSAVDHGGDVVNTAKEETQQVVGEAKDKAADLLAEARTHVGDQSRTQLQGLSVKLQELGDELSSMVDGSEQQGAVTDLARQLSTRVNALSTHLADREPQDVLEDARSFARRRPGTFIAGALVAGLVTGRLARGAKKAQSSDAKASPTDLSTGSHDVSSASTAHDTTIVPAGQDAAGQNTGGRA